MSHSPRQTKHATSDSSGKPPSEKTVLLSLGAQRDTCPWGCLACMHTRMCAHTHTHIRTAPRQLSSVFTQQVLLCNRGNKRADEDGGLEASSTLPPSPPRPQLQRPHTVLGVMLENLKDEEGNVTRQVRKEVAGVVRP